MIHRTEDTRKKVNGKVFHFKEFEHKTMIIMTVSSYDLLPNINVMLYSSIS